MYRHLLNNLILLSCAFYTSASNALPEDFEQEVIINSDRAQLDRKSGQVIYSGDVVLTQGTLRIESDTLTVIRKDDVFEKAIAEGKQAHYQQQIQANDPLTSADANRIEYLATKQQAVLIGDAKLMQANNELTGERIVYDMTTEVVTAGSSDDGTRSRIKVVIQPQAVKDNK